MKSHINPDAAVRGPADWTRPSIPAPEQKQKDSAVNLATESHLGVDVESRRKNEKAFFLLMFLKPYFIFPLRLRLISVLTFVFHTFSQQHV